MQMVGRVSWFCFGILATVTTWALCHHGPRVIHAAGGERFVELQYGYVTGSIGLRYSSYHDTETGQEVICVYSGDKPACYLTGRAWK